MSATRVGVGRQRHVGRRVTRASPPAGAEPGAVHPQRERDPEQHGRSGLPAHATHTNGGHLAALAFRALRAVVMTVTEESGMVYVHFFTDFSLVTGWPPGVERRGPLTQPTASR
ncbi:MAG: hypothetical protein ACT4NP_06210 [Pseudonocardiales bacterium]